MDRLNRMRNAVVYHLHNYHYRVHAYREKLAQLIDAKSDPPVPGRVHDGARAQVLNSMSSWLLGGARGSNLHMKPPALRSAAYPRR
jgi:hypothetical protein